MTAHYITSSKGVLSLGVLFFLFFWEAARPARSTFFAESGSWFRHVGRNLLLSVSNSVMITLLFSQFLWIWAANLTQKYDLGLLNWLNLEGWWRLLLVLILLDFWTYWWHVLNHVVPFFWRFHRVHHADPTMNVTTASRFHPGEILFSSILRIPIIFLLGLNVWELIFYEVVMFVVVQFHHANISVPGPLDRFLRLFIPTPEMHKVHHSNKRRETNSNYTSLLSVWDRLFRSFRLVDDTRKIKFGLDEYPPEKSERIRELYRMPLDPSGGPLEESDQA